MRLKRELLGVLALGILLFGLNAAWSFGRLGAAYSPFSVGPSVSALEFDASAVYAPGPTVLAYRHQLFADDVYERASQALPLPIGHALAIAPLIRVFGPELGWVLAQVLLAASILAAVYFLLRTFTASRAVALAWALAVSLFPFGPRNMLLLGEDSLVQPLEITRVAHPGFSFLILLLALHALFRARDKRFPFWLPAGLLIGFLPYTYYYYSSAAGAGLLVLLALALWRGRKELVTFLFRAGGVAAPVAAPYFLVLAKNRAQVRETLLPRLGSFTSHPDLRGAVLALAAGFVLWRLLDDERPTARWRLWLVTLLVGAGLGLNLQVLSHYSPQHDHFFNRLIQPVVFILIATFLAPRTPRRLACFAIALLVSGAAYRQISSAQLTLADHRANPALRWTREHTAPDSVIGATDNDLLSLLPGVSGRFSFVPMGQRTAASFEEILTRYLLLHKLEGDSWEEVATELSHQDRHRLWLMPAFQLFLHQGPETPASLERMHARWQALSVERELAARRLDYLIVPLNKKTISPGWAEVYRTEGWAIYCRARS